MNPKFQEIIELNEKFSHAIFFYPPMSASGRRSYEERNSQEFEEIINGIRFYACCSVYCSCKHVYHKSLYTINSIECNKTKFKNMLQKIEDYERIPKKDCTRFNFNQTMNSHKKVIGYDSL